MNSALLENGQVISAIEFKPEIHGSNIYCIDKNCRAVVIHVKGSEYTKAHFKTTGKGDEQTHKPKCGFFKPLSFTETLDKVKEYQEDLMPQGIKQHVIKLNFNRMNPEYESKAIEREGNRKSNEIKIKQSNPAPASITSLKTVVKLLQQNEPDLLASVMIQTNGKKFPLSELIITQEKAHELVWNEQAATHMGYFVYGEIEKVWRGEKVYYINFTDQNDTPFSLILFKEHFKYFTLSDKELIGRRVLAWGLLRKNSFKDKNTTQMIIKADNYIEYLPEE